MSERKRRKCGCVADMRGRRYWKHTDEDGCPEYALCEPFGGCSHPCNHKKMKMSVERGEGFNGEAMPPGPEFG